MNLRQKRDTLSEPYLVQSPAERAIYNGAIHCEYH